MPPDRSETRWWVLVCPDCSEIRHGYPCWNCNSGKSGKRVAVVPIDTLVAAMYERGKAIPSTTYRGAAAFVKTFALSRERKA